VLEFGLRRAHGFDGGLSASRAAYIGGCAGTSNVLAGKEFGIPVKGTMAHSWVMAFDGELKAFEDYSRVMPNNATILIDTYDTITGALNATESTYALDVKSKLVGVRLDSGDLCGLSKAVRAVLDYEGFKDVKIVASNDLDEYSIAALEAAHAPIDIYGVGTKLVTAYDNPALGGVYKLGAIKEDGKWVYKVKRSEDPAKTTNPGLLNVMRATTYDLIYDELGGCPEADYAVVVHGSELLLQDIFIGGQLVYVPPAIDNIRQKVINTKINDKRNIALNSVLADIKKGLLK
jgi:nicotinate phosphoribosyltransferase